MLRRTIGPFAELQGLPDIIPQLERLAAELPQPLSYVPLVRDPEGIPILPWGEASNDALDVLERMDFLNQVLAAHGCACSRPRNQEGVVSGEESDPYFGADLSEFVHCMVPHEEVDAHGVTTQVAVDIESITVEVDRYGELKIWNYNNLVT